MTMQNERQAAFIESARALRRRAAQSEPFQSPAVTNERRQRSLQNCHRYAATERAPRPLLRTSNGYVPELAARIDDDPNLADGSRRCARKIAELTYRQNREGRTLPVTVTYLARALGRCRRKVQRYFRQLEERLYLGRCGHVETHSPVYRPRREAPGAAIRRASQEPVARSPRKPRGDIAVTESESKGKTYGGRGPHPSPELGDAQHEWRLRRPYENEAAHGATLSRSRVRKPPHQ
jgi:hypothetical protein